MSREFSVFQFFLDGSYERVRQHVTVEEALRAATSLATSVGGRYGTTQRVIITDGGDLISWEWKFGEGVIFPEKTN